MSNKIVIDHGSFSIKYGYSGYNRPEGEIRSIAVKENSTTIVDINESFIDNFDMTLEYPIKNGVIMDYDIIDDMWECIFFEKLKIDPTKAYILLTEPPLTTRKMRNNVTEILKEKYNCKGIQFCNQQVLSLYSIGKNTGTVIDIGHDITRCVPIYESYIIESGIQMSDISGKTYNKYLCSQLEMYKTDDYMDKYKKNNNSYYKEFFIDKTISQNTIQETIINSIQSSDIDLRNNLAKNIMLTGGTSKMAGLYSDINNSLNTYKSTKMRVKYKVCAPKSRNYSAWLGGSILSCLPTFDKMWM